MKKVSVIVAVAVLTALVAVSCASDRYREGTAPIAQVQIHDAGGNPVTEVDIVTGATMLLRVVPLGTDGNPYTNNVQEDVTFVLARTNAEGERYVGDRFIHGAWGGIRVGHNRSDSLYLYLIDHENRATEALIRPGSYTFTVYAISGSFAMPNPPVPWSAYPHVADATGTVFTVNVLE